MTCCVCICKKGGLGTRKIYMEHAINLHFNVMMSLCRDRPKRAQITFSPRSHEGKQVALGIFVSRTKAATVPGFLREGDLEEKRVGRATNRRGPNKHQVPVSPLAMRAYDVCAGLDQPATAVSCDPSHGDGSLPARHQPRHTVLPLSPHLMCLCSNKR